MPRARRAWSALRLEIRNLLREEDSATSFWTNALLLVLANNAMDKWVMKLADKHEGWVTDVFTADVVANQREYTLPEGAGRIKRVLRVFPGNGSDTLEVPLVRAERFSEPTLQVSGSTQSDHVPTYRLVGELLFLEPTPTESVTGGIKIEVESAPLRLVADGDMLDQRFPDTFEALLVMETAVDALSVEGAQGNVPPGYVDHIIRMRNEYASAFEEFVETRSFNRVFGSPYYLGD